MAKIKVYVDDNFHYQHEDERYLLGESGTVEEAKAASKKLVDDFLANELAASPDQTAEQLYNQYVVRPGSIPDRADCVALCEAAVPRTLQ